jgi:hypothetical protein
VRERNRRKIESKRIEKRKKEITSGEGEHSLSHFFLSPPSYA